MTFPMTLTIGTTTIVIPINNTNTKANRNLDVVYTDEEWISWHVEQGLGIIDPACDPNSDEYIPF